MSKDEIKEVRAFDFAGTLWRTREDAEAKMAEMDLREWVGISSPSLDDREEIMSYLVRNRKKLIELLGRLT
jgi:hypothetical protein